MTEHSHSAARTSDALPFSGPVAFRSDENPAAHGDVCYIETCRCGAVRRINSNGGHEEYGSWTGGKPVHELAERLYNLIFSEVVAWQEQFWPLNHDESEYASAILDANATELWQEQMGARDKIRRMVNQYMRETEY